MRLFLGETLIHRSGDESRHGWITCWIISNKMLHAFYVLVWQRNVEPPDVF